MKLAPLIRNASIINLFKDSNSISCGMLVYKVEKSSVKMLCFTVFVKLIYQGQNFHRVVNYPKSVCEDLYTS